MSAGGLGRTTAPPAVLAALLAVAAAAVGCGGGQTLPDLFAVQRSGSVPGANLQLVVNDAGTVRCNGGSARPLPDPLLLDARAVSRDLHDPATKGLTLPPGPQPVLRYTARTQDGRVAFSDDSAHQPQVFFQLALLARDIARQACGLAR